MVVILVYYQMIYFIVDVGTDQYTSVAYMGLLEIPITVASWYIVKTYRRKPVYVVFYTIAVASSTALLLSDQGKINLTKLMIRGLHKSHQVTRS